MYGDNIRSCIQSASRVRPGSHFPFQNSGLCSIARLCSEIAFEKVGSRDSLIPQNVASLTVVVVVVVDSHIQRIVLASEETTVTQQVSHRPIKCQSRLWSQRGTRVNGSHHGDNPLLRPTGIQIATKSYAALQAMAPTNIKTVHQTSILHIESNLDRLGMLSPTHDQRSQQKTGKITEKLRSNQF